MERVSMTVVAGIAALATTYVCTASLYKRETQKYLYFNFLSLAISLYLIGNLIETSNDSIEASLIGMKIAYLGIPFIPPLWYLWVREYCGKRIEHVGIVLAIMAVPAFLTVLAWTWEQNHLLFDDFERYKDLVTGNLITIDGPLYPLKLIYLYAFNILGLYTIISMYMKGTRRFRQQAVFFFASTLIPIFNTATYVVSIAAYNIDITPYGLALTLFILSIMAPKYGLSNFSSILKDNALDHLHEGILLFDKDGIYMDSNEAFKKLFPQVNTIALGTSIDEMPYLPFTAAIFKESRNESHNHLTEFTREYEGSIKTYTLSVSQVELQNKTIGYTVIIYNITLLKNIMTDLEAKAYVDPLTGLYNRGHFFEKSVYEIERVKRTRGSLSVIIFDLDFFKRLNDSFGHLYGDYVLKTIAILCSTNLRKTDVMARYGGEEFCILLPDTSIDGARIKAENIRKKISTYTFDHGGVSTNVTASFGITLYDHALENDTIEQMIQRADENLYKAKNSGRNKVVS